MVKLSFLSTSENLEPLLNRILHHELTHAYSDYGLRRQNTTLQDKLTKSSVDKYQEEIFSPDNLEQMLSSMFYYLNKFETGAYMASAVSELADYIDEKFDFKEAVSKTMFCKQISFIKNNINLFIILVDKKKNVEETIIETANKISGGYYKFSTFNQLIKFLVTRTNKAWHHFEKQITKIWYDLITKS